MPKRSDYFPSKYLRAADLGDQQLVVEIDRVESDTFENDGRMQVKPVVYFKGDACAPLVCNATNFDTIADITGDGDDSKWGGKRIVLYAEKVPYRGKLVDSVRVKKAANTTTLQEVLQDEIPW